MAARVNRGEALLAKVGSRLGMTEKGREWLIGALDPFHDTPLDVCGFPDGNKNPVCVQIVRAGFNLACPTAITAGTWDCNIISTPWAKSNISFNASAKQGGTNSNPTNEVYTNINNGNQNVVMGGVIAQSVNTGTSFNPAQAFPNGTNNVVQSLAIPDQYMIGNSRIIGKAFEIHNTTSDLNRQGMLTTYTIPVGNFTSGYDCITNTFNGTTFINAANADVYTVPMWPQSQAAALLIPSSRQWTAEQGCYTVHRLDTAYVPASEQGYGIQPFVDGGDVSNATLNLFPQSHQSALFANNFVQNNVFWDNFDMRGTMLTGLSLQTTLTVNITWIIERQPDPTIADLVVLARSPPERDPVALDLYTHISDHLPSSVPVNENGLGDWFMDALSTAADFVAPMASAIPGVGGLIGGGITGLNNLYKQHKSDYAASPYAPVSTREVKSVYNAASSAIRQAQGNRSKGPKPKKQRKQRKGKGKSKALVVVDEGARGGLPFITQQNRRARSGFKGNPGVVIEEM